MNDQRSIAKVRNQLARLIRVAESGKIVELTRRGETVAVLIGRRYYERLAARGRRFSEAWDAFTRDVDLQELEIDPDEVFGATRDELPGRDTRR